MSDSHCLIKPSLFLNTSAAEAILSEVVVKSEEVTSMAKGLRPPSSSKTTTTTKKNRGMRKEVVIKQEKKARHQQEEEEEHSMEGGGGASEAVEEEEVVVTVRCQFCSKVFVLGGAKKEKKKMEMQEHVNSCMILSNKRAKDEELKEKEASSSISTTTTTRSHPSCAPRKYIGEEMPSQASKALESCLSVPDPTFLVSLLKSWVLSPTNKVPPSTLTTSIFNQLMETRSAHRAQCFYDMLCLSLQCHPPHIVTNSWRLANQLVLSELVEEVGRSDDDFDCTAYRSKVLALSYLVKMFQVSTTTTTTTTIHHYNRLFGCRVCVYLLIRPMTYLHNCYYYYYDGWSDGT